MSFKYNKILVIGSNSFTGSSYIDFALNKSCKLVGISRSSEYNKVMLPYKSNPFLDKFKFYKLDVNKHINKILEIIDSFKPEVVINFSAQGEVRNSWKFPEHWYTTNCLSIVKLTNALVKRKFIKRYISISTPEVYGTTNKRLLDSNFYNPSTPYAASKLAGDLHLNTLLKKYNFPVVFSRSANVYGPHQQLYRIIPRTIIYLKMRKKIKLHGKGESKRSFIHIKDVVEAIHRIIKFGKIGEVYHVAPKANEISIYKIVKLICNIMGYDFNLCVKLISENYGQDEVYKLNSKKIRDLNNWSEQISLKDGINETIEWVNFNWEIIKKMPLEYLHKV